MHNSIFRNLFKLIGPYFSSKDRVKASALLITIISLNLLSVFITVKINAWQGRFYNSIQDKNFPSFKIELQWFGVLAACFILVVVYRIYLQQMLEIKWRTWMTDSFLKRWLDNKVYYLLEVGTTKSDNPDQRIADDLKLFAGDTLTLFMGLLNATVTLISFIGILWLLSGALTFSISNQVILVPGYMVWVAVIYAFVGSFLTHIIGKPLVKLNFEQQKYEAYFRFGLIRVREQSEGIALYKGEQSESKSLTKEFQNIISNWWNIMKCQKRLAWFTSGYAQLAIIFPFIVASPRYFSGAIALGGLMQIASSFGKVQDSLSWFIESYPRLAQWRASLNRLVSFSETMAKYENISTGISHKFNENDLLKTESLILFKPDGSKISNYETLQISKGDKVLIQGPSGTGKSTLFRALADIWPFGDGIISVPMGSFFVPQKSYLPITSLYNVLNYPSAQNTFSKDLVIKTLEECDLQHLVKSIDEEAHWEQRLSPGEQQRISFVRIFLHRPKWIFLDEATSALDENTQSKLYKLLLDKLSESTIVSIAHRSTLKDFHNRVVNL